MKRLENDDQAQAQRALEDLADAREAIEAIDLRKYNGDPEIRDALKGARDEIKAAALSLRHVRSLRWSR